MEDAISVLYVNDDADLLDLIRTRLERENDRITVRTAGSVDEGLEILETRRIDCVLSDYHMPDRTGLDFLRTVRAEDADLPFILFTETGDERVASESISAGVTDYLIQETIGDPSPLLARKVVAHVESRRQERRTERTNQHLRAVAGATDDVLWIFSADWEELRFVNPAYETVFGRSIGTLHANPQSFLAQVDDEDVDRVTGAMERASNGDAIQVEYRVHRPEGHQLWVESRCRPVRDETGAVQSVAGFTREITDEKYYEQELLVKNEQLETFASTVAHDLRNPLNIADGHVDLAREEHESEHLEIGARALARMDDLIDDLLGLAKEGSTIDDRSPVAFETLVRTSSENVVLSGATLEITGSTTIRCDPARVSEALENLIRNALEHGGESATITAGVLEDGNGFYLEDDGPGIPPAEQGRVFERGHTTSQQGTGLGLAIVKRIVEAHGWQIDVGESDGGGARFEVSSVTTGE